MKTSTRNWILAIVFLGLLAGLGLGTMYVLKRGARKRGLYEKAIIAYNAEDYENSILHLKTLLRTDPDNLAAFQLLSTVMYKQGRLAELGDYTREWVERTKNPEFGWQALVELEFAQGRFLEAERIARARAEEHPLLVQRVVMVARDISGTIPDRMAAVEAARRIASLAENEYTVADAHIFAGEMLLELAPFLREEDRLEAEKQGKEHLLEAGKAARQAAKRQPGAQYDALMAVLNLHSEKETEVAAGERWLSMRFDAVKDSRANEANQIRAHLVAHFIRKENWDEARKWSLGLENGSFVTVIRTLRRFREAGRRKEALELIDRIEPDRRVMPIRLSRAQILLGGDKEQRADGVAEIRSILATIDPNPALVAGLFITLLRSGETEAAFDLLAEVRRAHPDQRFDALFAAAASQQEGREEEALDIARELGSQASEPAVALDVVKLLAGSNQEALFKYLEGQVLLPGEDGARFLSLRANLRAVQMSKAKDETERAALRDSVIADLTALLERKECAAVILNAAAWRCLVLDEPVLGGRFLARAIESAPPMSGLMFASLGMLKRMGKDQRVGKFAEGIRLGAESLAIKVPLEGLADAIDGDATAIAAVRQRLGSVEPGSAGEILSLHFAAQLCGLTSEWGEAEKCARRLCRLDPDSESAVRFLGRTLMRQGRFDDVLELHKGTENPTPAVLVQSIDALFALDRKEDALVVARRLARDWPQMPASMLILARAHVLAGDEKSALAVLSAAQPTAESEYLRAELLAGQRQDAAAEQIYKRLLAANLADRRAWLGLFRVQSKLDRVLLFASTATDALASEALADQPATRAAILNLRGQALEAQGRPVQALADYEEAIRLTTNNALALNNAAWLIREIAPDRIEEAIAFSERALELVPTKTEFTDTAAHLYFEAGKFERAREVNERAIELVKPLVLKDPERHKPRERRFRILHARILERLGSKDEAIAELREIRKETPEDPEGRAAGALLESFGAN